MSHSIRSAPCLAASLVLDIVVIIIITIAYATINSIVIIIAIHCL